MRGSIQKRNGKRGVSWSAVIDLGTDASTGKRKQQRLPAQPTRKAAEEMLTKALHELRSGAYVRPSKETVGGYLAQWLDATAPTVKPRTVHTYAGVVKRHLTPELGAIPLGKLSAMDVQALYGRLLARGLHPSTVRLAHAVLRRALDRAVDLRLVVVNVANAAKPPRRQRPNIRTWTADEARAYLAAAADDELSALWHLALLGQLRLGELLALRWSDVEPERGALTVRRTVTRDAAGRLAFGEPKSVQGRRQVALGAELTRLLRAHRTAQIERRLRLGSTWHDDDAVFDRGDGRPAAARTVQKRCKGIAADAGVPVLRFHDLRHTGATLLIADGVPAKVVAERLGHASIAVTLDLYAHVQEGMQRDAAARIEGVLRAGPGDTAQGTGS